MNKSNKSLLRILVICLLISLITAVFAFYYRTQSIDNDLTVGVPKVYLGEKFDPTDKWVPGEDKQKEVKFGNEGDIDSYLRVRFTPKLVLADGTEVTDSDILKDFALNYADDFDTNFTDGGDGWYYYKNILPAGQETPLTLKSVTISDSVGNDVHGNFTDYSGSTFTVDIEGEFVQATGAGETAPSSDWTIKPWS